MTTSLSKKLNIATWCVALILTLIPAMTHKPAEQVTGIVIATLFWMAVYYLFSLYIAPVFLLSNKITQFFLVSAVVVSTLPFLGYSLLFLSKAVFSGSFTDFYQGYSAQMHLSGLKAMALAGVYGSFFRLIAEHFKK